MEYCANISFSRHKCAQTNQNYRVKPREGHLASVKRRKFIWQSLCSSKQLCIQSREKKGKASI